MSLNETCRFQNILERRKISSFCQNTMRGANDRICLGSVRQRVAGWNGTRIGVTRIRARRSTDRGDFQTTNLGVPWKPRTGPSRNRCPCAAEFRNVMIPSSVTRLMCVDHRLTGTEYTCSRGAETLMLCEAAHVCVQEFALRKNYDCILNRFPLRISEKRGSPRLGTPSASGEFDIRVKVALIWN